MARDNIELNSARRDLKMQFDITRHSAINEWLQGMDYVQPMTGAIEVMYSYNGITGTISY